MLNMMQCCSFHFLMQLSFQRIKTCSFHQPLRRDDALRRITDGRLEPPNGRRLNWIQQTSPCVSQRVSQCVSQCVSQSNEIQGSQQTFKCSQLPARSQCKVEKTKSSSVFLPMPRSLGAARRLCSGQSMFISSKHLQYLVVTHSDLVSTLTDGANSHGQLL